MCTDFVFRQLYYIKTLKTPTVPTLVFNTSLFDVDTP